MKNIQKYCSSKTSIKQIAKVFKAIEWTPHTINLDYGGGKYDLATEYLKTKSVMNYVYDPYNRSPEHNFKVKCLVWAQGFAHTVTCANVLNVIKEKQARFEVLSDIQAQMREDGIFYCQIYEGNRSGIGRCTNKDNSWQNNKKVKEYFKEIEKFFTIVEVVNHNIILCIQKERKS
jgi:hypothetical protein